MRLGYLRLRVPHREGKSRCTLQRSTVKTSLKTPSVEVTNQRFSGDVCPASFCEETTTQPTNAGVELADAGEDACTHERKRFALVTAMMQMQGGAHAVILR